MGGSSMSRCTTQDPFHQPSPLISTVGWHVPCVICRRLVGSACDQGDDDAPLPLPAYLTDADARRALLESALWRPQLPYSSELLDSYGLGDRGWDLLPPQPTTTRPFTVADAEALAGGQTLDGSDVVELLPAVLPNDEAGWRNLGRRVFAHLPMREDGYLTWLASNPKVWPDVGVTPRDDGSVRGLVVFPRARGGAAVGVTCAFCHGGDDLLGRGDRRLDVGEIRARHAEALGRTARNLRDWGPGRADVTDDGVPSITAIPDLWGVGKAAYLNASGAIAVDSLGTLAMRFETQYIKGHRMRTRPARTLMWALAQFLAELTPPTAPARDTTTRSPFAASSAPPALVDAGRESFDQRCARCHQPDRAFSGRLVRADVLAVEASVATTPERGTGFYKVPSLLGVRGNAPYLHDGSVPTLHALLASGHPLGNAPDESTRNALTAYLQTL
ncbi:MAG: mono/diheme cytochrome c family protein [Myxococcota bacterium]|jgi:mono/diheme cytochrome c family protein